MKETTTTYTCNLCTASSADAKDFIGVHTNGGALSISEPHRTKDHLCKARCLAGLAAALRAQPELAASPPAEGE